jgi:DNA-binding GntR family transcriptional regulator
MYPRSISDRVTDDELIRVCAVAARVACRRMTPRYLKALHDSVGQACCLPSGFDWDRKAAAHAEIVNLLADAAADPALAVLVRAVPGQLHDLMVTVGPAAGGIIAGSRRRLLALLEAGDADGARTGLARRGHHCPFGISEELPERTVAGSAASHHPEDFP